METNTIYVASTKSELKRGWVKVGITDQPIESRIKQSTEQRERYKLIWCGQTEHYKTLEKLIHKNFKNQKEWVKAKTEDVIAFIDAYLSSVDPCHQNIGHQIDLEKRKEAARVLYGQRRDLFRKVVDKLTYKNGLHHLAYDMYGELKEFTMFSDQLQGFKQYSYVVAPRYDTYIEYKDADTMENVVDTAIALSVQGFKKHVEKVLSKERQEAAKHHLNCLKRRKEWSEKLEILKKKNKTFFGRLFYRRATEEMITLVDRTYQWEAQRNDKLMAMEEIAATYCESAQNSAQYIKTKFITD